MTKCRYVIQKPASWSGVSWLQVPQPRSGRDECPAGREAPSDYARTLHSSARGPGAARCGALCRHSSPHSPGQPPAPTIRLAAPSLFSQNEIEVLIPCNVLNVHRSATSLWHFSLHLLSKHDWFLFYFNLPLL